MRQLARLQRFAPAALMLDIGAQDALAAPPSPHIATPRLVLRELRLDDAPAIAAQAGDKRVAKYLIAVPTPYPVVLARRWIDARLSWWIHGRGVTLAIARREAPDELIGTVSLRRFARDRRAELGYWLGIDAWGKGYATEAADALVGHGFSQLRLSRIYAQVLEGNEASCRVLEKLGMTNEGIRRRHIRKGKKLLDVVMFGMLRHEWFERS
ncbi:MAG: GNAT family N-acetyltransferase [Kofleriaceae bacterium]|nr:GNAT family N-acetyltransferase [Kofleriaceae bacterium]